MSRGRSHCAAADSYACEAPAGYRSGTGWAAAPGVKRSELHTCAYCGEPVCTECSSELTGDLAGKRACVTHEDAEIARWLGVA